MAHFQHQGDRAVVSFSGELTVDAAVDLVETIEMLASVYFYAVVELVIASPGGSSMALDHYVDATRRWRDAGVVLRTRVTACAESAAALVLSLGDERLAEPCARLLFHPFRVIQPGSLTAYQSARMYADLARLDEAYLARLVDRAMDGADAASVVSADVESSDLQALDRLRARLRARWPCCRSSSLSGGAASSGSPDTSCVRAPHSSPSIRGSSSVRCAMRGPGTTSGSSTSRRSPIRFCPFGYPRAISWLRSILRASR